MDIMQSPKSREKDIHSLLPNNPFVPPTGDACYINNLPPELLSRIFEVGAADDEEEDDDDGGGVESFVDRLKEWASEEFLSGEGESESDVEMADKQEKEEETEKDQEEEESGDEDASDGTGSSDFPSPWPPFQIVVSHVCHHWRNVAFSTPSLWTTINVPPEVRPPYEHVPVLLERSKGLPIDIFIDCEPQDPDSEDDGCEDGDAPSEDDLKFLLSLLIPHVHRWRSIEVQVLSYNLMYTFLSAVSDPSVPAASQLTSLQLYHHEDVDDVGVFGHPSLSEHFTLFGGSAPNLTEIHLWGVHVDWSQGWISSAPNLVELDLAYHAENIRPSWAQFATILRGAPRLDILKLRLSGPSGPPAEWVFETTPERPAWELNEPIQLLKLTDFGIAFQSPERSIALFRKFYMPSLKDLDLDFDEGDYTDLITHLAGPATSLTPLTAQQEQPRSLLSGLENLKIGGLPCRAECVQTLYGELQNLEALNINLSYLSPVFTDILCQPCTLPGRGDVWLPRLTRLWISGVAGELIREVVEKRRDAGVPLKSLHVEESCDVDEDDVDWFKENLETFDFFEGSDDEDVLDIEDVEDGYDDDEWSDVD